MLTTYKINMDLWKPSAVPKLDAVQYDGATRSLCLSLFENGVAWPIPSDAHVMVKFEKNDGMGGEYDQYPNGDPVWSAEGNTLTVGLVAQMFTAAGSVKLSIALMLRDQLLQTFPVFIRVHPCVEAEQEPSGNYVKLGGYVPMPGKAEAGQFLMVDSVGPSGSIASVACVDRKLVQETGDDPTAVMSQRAVTQALLERSQATPKYAETLEECTDETALYVLPDGYLYAYLQQENKVPSNVFDPDKAYYNKMLTVDSQLVTNRGILQMYRVSVSMENPYLVKITGVPLTSTNGLFALAIYYDGNGNPLGAHSLTREEHFILFSQEECVLDLYREEYRYAEQVSLALGIGGTGSISAADVAALRVEFVPKSIHEFEYRWVNTGHAFVPADYEERIVALENAAKSGQEELPEYWRQHLEEKISRIRQLQEAGGKDCFSFAVLTDVHEDYNLGKCSGRLAEEVAQQCQIKYVLALGDVTCKDPVGIPERMEESFANAEKIL